ncbi:MAG: GNAT family N-acetyltransferase [Bryobacter sp.]|nr:GNAT family N-acetyltransferase [Bryobacter sp.]
MNRPTLAVTVWYLERPAEEPPPRIAAPRADLTIVEAREITVSFYRYLYNTVGAPWRWYERRLLDDAALAAAIRKPGVNVYVLYAGGTPAGYIELDHEYPESTEICYFGIMPEFIGERLGPYLLAWGIAQCSRKVTVNTCSLDHPKALGLYERMRFRHLRRVEKHIEDPQDSG